MHTQQTPSHYLVTYQLHRSTAAQLSLSLHALSATSAEILVNAVCVWVCESYRYGVHTFHALKKECIYHISRHIVAYNGIMIRKHICRHTSNTHEIDLSIYLSIFLSILFYSILFYSIIYLPICIHTYIHTYIDVYTFKYVYTYTYIHTCLHPSIYYIYTYIQATPLQFALIMLELRTALVSKQ